MSVSENDSSQRGWILGAAPSAASPNDVLPLLGLPLFQVGSSVKLWILAVAWGQKIATESQKAASEGAEGEGLVLGAVFQHQQQVGSGGQPACCFVKQERAPPHRVYHGKSVGSVHAGVEPRCPTGRMWIAARHGQIGVL